MGYNELVAKAQTYFPNLQIKYKDQSPFMKVLGKLVFFAPEFMTSYVTTIGETIYLPNDQYAINNPNGFIDVFIHECTHMHDEKKIGFWYKPGYLFPQILAPFMLLLLLVMTWKIVLPLALLMLAPLPAPWRMYFERKAYFVQMLAGQQIYGYDPDVSAPHYATHFKNSDYYWMWIFGEDKQFAQEAINIKAGKPSSASEPDLAQMVSDLVAAAKV